MGWRNNSDNDEGNSIEYDGLTAQHQIHWRDKKLEMILLHHVQGSQIARIRKNHK